MNWEQITQWVSENKTHIVAIVTCVYAVTVLGISQHKWDEAWGLVAASGLISAHKSDHAAQTSRLARKDQ